MKTSLIPRLWIALTIAALSFSFSLFGEETSDMLSKACDLVHQVSNPTSTPQSDAQRIELLTQALRLAQEAPNHRLKGYRVKAIQDIRAALAEIRKGDPDHKATDSLRDAGSELSAAVSLVGSNDAVIPAAQPSAIQPPATQSSSKRQVIVHFDLPKSASPLTGSIRVSYSDGQKTDKIPVENGEARFEVPVPNQLNIDPSGLDGYSFEVKRVSIGEGMEPEQINLPLFPAGAIYGEVAKADGSPAPNGVDIHVQETKKPQDGNTRDFSVKKEGKGLEGGSFHRFVAAPLPFGCDYAVVVWNGCTFALSPPCHIDEKTPVQNVKVVIPEGKTIRLHFVDSHGNGVQGLAFEMDYTTPWGMGFVNGMTGIERENLPATDKDMVTTPISMRRAKTAAHGEVTRLFTWLYGVATRT